MSRYFYEVELEHQGRPGVVTNLPKRGTKKSAGYDFYTKQDIYLHPGESCRVPLDVGAVMPDNQFLDMRLRSSIGFNQPGVFLSNSAAVIDADFSHNPKNDGNITLSIINLSGAPFIVNEGDRVAQGIFVNYYTIDDDDTTEERVGGGGSTGK